MYNIRLTELPLANATCTGNSVLPVEAADLLPPEPTEFHRVKTLVVAPSGVVKNANSALFFEDSSQGQSTSVLEFFNEVLGKAHRVNRSQVCTDDRLNQDALIRGIVDGWNAVERYPYFCPLWGVLRQIDRRVFRLSSTMTRLCMLRMIHFMLLVRDHLTALAFQSPQ